MDAELGYMGPVMVFDLDDTLYAEADFVLSGFRAVSHMAIQYRPVTSAETWYQLMKPGLAFRSQCVRCTVRGSRSNRHRIFYQKLCRYIPLP